MQDTRQDIKNHVLREIISGKLSVGDRIPTEMELAEKFSTNRMNAHIAIKDLERKSIVNRQKRRGTFVARLVDESELTTAVAEAGKAIYVFGFRDKDNIHWDETTLQALENSLNEKGYSAIYRNIDDKLDRESIAEILDRADEGLCPYAVIFPKRAESEKFFVDNIDLWSGRGIRPFMFFRGDIPANKWPFASLQMDPLGEGLLAGEYIRGNTGKPVIFLTRKGVMQSYWASSRAHGLSLGLGKSITGNTQDNITIEEDGYENCISLLQSGESEIVVTSNDLVASEFVDFARSKGMRAPYDFNLISFDNNPLHREYGLTTVAPPLTDIGRFIAHIVTEGTGASGFGMTPSCKVASRIIERETCRF